MTDQLTLEQVNEQRMLMNFEYTHLYFVATRGSDKGTLLPLDELLQEISTEPEYGVQLEDKLWSFGSLGRCQEEASKVEGANVLRLGRNSKARRGSKTDAEIDTEIEQLRDRFIPAHDLKQPRAMIALDESGAFDIPVVRRTKEDRKVTAALRSAGYRQHSGCRPSNVELLNIYSDQQLDLPRFAEAVVWFCEIK